LQYGLGRSCAHGVASAIVDDLLADEVPEEITELTLMLPAGGGIEAHLLTLELVPSSVAPALGWSPVQ
jgi:hypothetical protein